MLEKLMPAQGSNSTIPFDHTVEGDFSCMALPFRCVAETKVLESHYCLMNIILTQLFNILLLPYHLRRLHYKNHVISYGCVLAHSMYNLCQK
jgi:hypothetical protein